MLSNYSVGLMYMYAGHLKAEVARCLSPKNKYKLNILNYI